MIFLYFFFDVVARQTSGADADLLRSLWMTGIIPFMVGVGLLINGFFVSRRLVRLKEQLLQAAMSAPQPPPALPAKTTDQLVANASPSRGASVIEDTTAHLSEPVAAPLGRETD